LAQWFYLSGIDMKKKSNFNESNKWIAGDCN